MARGYVWVKKLTPAEKAGVTAACERLIAETLTPRYFPCRDEHGALNRPVRIFGKWRGNSYSFLVNFRSDDPDRIRDAWNIAFARLDHVEERLAGTVFDVMWHRHTGEWRPLHRDVPLDRALHLIDTEPLLRPPILAN